MHINDLIVNVSEVKSVADAISSLSYAKKKKKRIEKRMNFVISGEEAQHGGLLAHFLGQSG